ncbi:MAG TPA: hypothetical protein VGL81_22630 [Polyangiaceae bacterium]|jgi:hypothetical protein
MNIPDPSWKKLGSTSNAEFYLIREDILGIVPYPDTVDNQKTARESIGFQEKYWRSVGHGGAVVVFMDTVVEQDAAARTVYAEEVHASPTTCYALVGESFYGFAASQVFTGLSKPGRPTSVFRSLTDAQPWIEEQNHPSGRM